jgi:hypothetical protein
VIINQQKLKRGSEEIPAAADGGRRVNKLEIEE